MLIVWQYAIPNLGLHINSAVCACSIQPVCIVRGLDRAPPTWPTHGKEEHPRLHVSPQWRWRRREHGGTFERVEHQTRLTTAALQIRRRFCQSEYGGVGVGPEAVGCAYPFLGDTAQSGQTEKGDKKHGVTRICYIPPDLGRLGKQNNCILLWVYHNVEHIASSHVIFMARYLLWMLITSNSRR